MATTAHDDLFLTEMILFLHNEVQSAVDYIASVASRQGAELGKGSAVMGIENLREKAPFLICRGRRGVPSTRGRPGRWRCSRR